MFYNLKLLGIALFSIAKKSFKLLITNRWVRRFFLLIVGTVGVGILTNNLSEDIKPFKLSNIENSIQKIITFLGTLPPSTAWIILILFVIIVLFRDSNIRHLILRRNTLAKIVGRSQEITLFKSLLETNATHCLIIWGLPGTGKTTLLKAIIELARHYNYMIVGQERREDLHVPYTGESCTALLIRSLRITKEESKDVKLQLHETLSSITRKTLITIDEFPSDGSFLNEFNDYLRQIIALNLPIMFVIASTSKPILLLDKSIVYCWDTRGVRGFNQEETIQFVNLRSSGYMSNQLSKKLYRITGGNPKQLDLLISQPNWQKFIKTQAKGLNLEVLEYTIAPLKNEANLLDTLNKASIISSMIAEWPAGLGKHLVEEWDDQINVLHRRGFIEYSRGKKVKVPEMVRDYLINNLSHQELRKYYLDFSVKFEKEHIFKDLLREDEILTLSLETLARAGQRKDLIHKIYLNREKLTTYAWAHKIWSFLYQNCELELSENMQQGRFLFFCAQIAELISRFQDARSLYSKSLQTFSSAGILDSIALIQIRIGETFIATGDFQAAIAYFQSGLVRIEPNLTNSTLYFSGALGLARSYIGVGNYSSALKSFELTHQVEKYDISANLLISFIRAKTLALRDLGEYQDALNLANTIPDILLRIDDGRVKSQAFRTLSVCSKMTWKLEDALKYGEYAFIESKRVFDIRGLGNACWAIGEAHRMLQSLDNALDTLSAGLVWQEKADDKENIFYSTISIVEVLTKLHRFDQAIDELAKAQNYAEQLGPYEHLHVRLLRTVLDWCNLEPAETIPVIIDQEFTSISSAYNGLSIKWPIVYISLIQAFELEGADRNKLLAKCAKILPSGFVPESICLDALVHNKIKSRRELLSYLNKRF